MTKEPKLRTKKHGIQDDGEEVGYRSTPLQVEIKEEQEQLTKEVGDRGHAQPPNLARSEAQRDSVMLVTGTQNRTEDNDLV